MPGPPRLRALPLAVLGLAAACGGGGGGGPAGHLSLTPKNLSVARGGGATAVACGAFEGGGAAELALVPATRPDGIAVAGVPAAAGCPPGDAALEVRVDAAFSAAPAGFTVRVRLTGPGPAVERELPITVAATTPVLVVDDDGGDGLSDTFFGATLAGNDGCDVARVGVPDPALLVRYEAVVWYTGARGAGGCSGDLLGDAAQRAVRDFLDAGGRRLVLVSPWTSACAGGGSTLLGEVFGVVDVYPAFLQDRDFVVDGAARGPAAGRSFAVSADGSALPPAYTAGLTPAPAADVLLYAHLAGAVAESLPAAVGRHGAGAAGTSTAILVSFTAERVTDGATGTGRELLEALLAY
ncbi:hypothetical protein [Anaeromyxobacter oryzae]|uniref:Lipoprotein n=1 Tax=Anaeromyxobacter oryzae TaxID=2918170 RepID=A0ABM7WVM7_9BACT|nr:hypothetical protein [Anaeromyxobacter oryzae]BDG03555.1 hypothetical protein AMOR_25510 [Anaeromyxobacter oryzae]